MVFSLVNCALTRTTVADIDIQMKQMWFLSHIVIRTTLFGRIQLLLCMQEWVVCLCKCGGWTSLLFSHLKHARKRVALNVIQVIIMCIKSSHDDIMPVADTMWGTRQKKVTDGGCDEHTHRLLSHIVASSDFNASSVRFVCHLLFLLIQFASNAIILYFSSLTLKKARSTTLDKMLGCDRNVGKKTVDIRAEKVAEKME